MASTVVHLAFAGLLAAALLGPYFDRRAVLVVFVATAIPDLDSFIALFSTVGHREALHTFVIPIGLGVLLALDTRVREESFVRTRWGQWGVAVGWMSLLAYAVAGIGLDFVGAGVNAFWPVHDQAYALNGKIELSDQRGVVQTFVDLSPDDGGAPRPKRLGNSSQIEMDTGVNPDPSGTEENPERIFPVVRSGWQLLVLVVGAVVTGAKLRLVESRE